MFKGNLTKGILATMVFVMAVGVALANDTSGIPHYDSVNKTAKDAESHYDSVPATGSTLFHAPLDSNGVTGYTDWPSGFPVPTSAWFGWDPTNDAVGTETFASNGDPTAIDTPFCPGGDFSAVDSSGDPGSVSCAAGVNFDGTGDFYGPADVGDWDGGDFSVCSVVRTDAAFATQNIAARGGAQYWRLQTLVGFATLQVQTDVGFGIAAYSATAFLDQWVFICATGAEGGNIFAYLNGVASASAAMPAGTTTSTSEFYVGHGEGGSNFTGDIAAVWIWNGTELTAAQVKEAFHHFSGLTEVVNNESVVTATNVAPSACWVDGQVEEFGLNWMKIGCGANFQSDATDSAYGGFVSTESDTSIGLYSIDLSNWTEVGVTPVTCSQTTTPELYRDGRDTCKVTDNNGAVDEYITMNLGASALNVGDDVVVCIAGRKGGLAESYVDLVVQENSGSGCTPLNHDFTGVATDTTWRTYEFATTWADTDCTTMTLSVGPNSTFGTPSLEAETHIAVLGVYAGPRGSTECPMAIPIVATAAAQTVGDDYLSYSVSTPVVDGSGQFSNTSTLQATVKFNYSSVSSTYRVLQIDNGNDTSFQRLGLTSGNTWSFDGSGGIAITTGLLEVAADTDIVFSGVSNYDIDSYQAFRNGQLVGTDNSATLPAAWDEINVGVSTFGTQQSEGHVWFKDIKIKRKQ